MTHRREAVEICFGVCAVGRQALHLRHHAGAGSDPTGRAHAGGTGPCAQPQTSVTGGSA